jgi:hypothetical protein
MLSLASGLNRWTGGRRITGTLALPFVGAFVGIFLTSTLARTRAPSMEVASATSVTAAVPVVESDSPLLHPSVAVLDAQRRTFSSTGDALPAVVAWSAAELHARTPAARRPKAWRSNRVVRGYDATAPPFRRG